MPDKFPITAEGFAAMKEELQELISCRGDISERIAVAREHGDLKENAEYHAAREQQGFNEAKIAELEDRVARAEVIDISSLSGNDVKFGAKVKLLDLDTEAEVVYQIVSEYEADIQARKISIVSPIAKALIGKSIGDEVEVHTPRGEKDYEILSVEYA